MSSPGRPLQNSTEKKEEEIERTEPFLRLGRNNFPKKSRFVTTLGAGFFFLGPPTPGRKSGKGGISVKKFFKENRRLNANGGKVGFGLAYYCMHSFFFQRAEWKKRRRKKMR